MKCWNESYVAYGEAMVGLTSCSLCAAPFPELKIFNHRTVVWYTVCRIFACTIYVHVVLTYMYACDREEMKKEARSKLKFSLQAFSTMRRVIGIYGIDLAMN